MTHGAKEAGAAPGEGPPEGREETPTDAAPEAPAEGSPALHGRHVGGPLDSRASSRLRRPWISLLLLFAAGVIIYLPALRSPYFLDDYVHAWMAEGTFPTRRSPFDLYNFINDADRPVLVARGMLPWWTDPGLSIRFFRPLS